MADDEMVELRGMAHKTVIAYLDGFAHAKRKNRMQIVNQVLLQWAREQAHIQTVLSNTTRGNPPLPETSWGDPE